MKNIGFQCMNDATHVFKSKSNNRTDGLNCPICKRPVSPYVFSNEHFNKLPFYEDVKKKSTNKNLNITAVLDMDTDNLSAKLKAIAKHAEALAKELDMIVEG